MLRKLVKNEQASRILSSSYENAIMKRVLATHAPDGRKVDLDPLLCVIEDIFRHAVPADIDCVITTGAQSHSGNIHALPGFGDINGTSNGLANILHTISCEFSCKYLDGSDAHTSTLAILNLLSSYTWEAKVVISLGAFAINFGEFWVVAQLLSTNPLAKSIALLKDMPDVMEHYKLLKSRFDAINLLIKAMLDVTKCIITFKNLSHQYIQDEHPPKSTAMAYIPTASYWSIKSMVACISQLTSLLGMNYDRYITATSEGCELSSLTHKVYNIREHLKSILVLCYQKIEEKQDEEYHKTRARKFEARHGENTSNSPHDIAMSHQTREDVRSNKEISATLISHQTRKDVRSNKEVPASVISHQTHEDVGSHKEIPTSLIPHQTREDIGPEKEISPSPISHQTSESVGPQKETPTSLISHQTRKDVGSHKEILASPITHQTREDVSSNKEISASPISHQTHEDVGSHKEISTSLIPHQSGGDIRTHKEISASPISHQTHENVKPHKETPVSLSSHQTCEDVGSHKETSASRIPHQTQEDSWSEKEIPASINPHQTCEEIGSHKEISASSISHQTREHVGTHKETSASLISYHSEDLGSHKEISVSQISHSQSMRIRSSRQTTPISDDNQVSMGDSQYNT